MLGRQGGKEAAEDGQRELSRGDGASGKSPEHQLPPGQRLSCPPLPLVQRNGLRSSETWKH